MELSDLAAVARRRWWIVVVVVAVGAGTGFASGSGSVSVEATAVVHFTTPTSETAQELEPRDAADGLRLADSPEAAERAAATLGADPGVLARRVSSNITADTSGQRYVTVTASAPDETEAAAIANQVATVVVSLSAEADKRALEEAIASATATAAELDGAIAGLGKAGTGGPGADAKRQAAVNQLEDVSRRVVVLQGMRDRPYSGAEVVRLATPADGSRVLEPPSTREGRAVAGGLVGLLLGCALAAIIHRADPTISTKADAESTFGLPVVAEIPRPRAHGLRRRSEWVDDPAVAEAYRALRTRSFVMPVRAGARPPAVRKVFLVTSAGAEDGKSEVIVNLADAVAERGADVLVVGGDLRRPTLSDALGVRTGSGLTDLLTSGADLERLASLSSPTSIDGVRLLSGGSEFDDPGALMGAAADLLQTLRELPDVVIVDSPPLLVANDASELAAAVDGVLVVARAGRTLRSDAAKAGELLLRLGAPVIGVALTGVPSRPDSYSPRARGGRSAGSAGERIRDRLSSRS